MELGCRLVGALLRLIGWLFAPLYLLRAHYQKKTLPELSDPLLLLSATELARKIRRQELSSYATVKAYINRIQVVNPILNAVVQERFQDALVEAKNVDDYIGKHVETEDELANKKPFFGVPMTIKESCRLRGMSLCVGNVPRAGLKASDDGEAVALLRESGAILLLVSNTPEFCMSWETTNCVTGTTCNPYDTSKVAGGSSGGEAALIGAGASVVGIGSDLAGSIRLPAMFNGIFGHKPSPGIVSPQGHIPNLNDKNFYNYLSLGPLSRYAEDLSTMMKVLSGKQAPLYGFDDKIDVSKIRVYHMDEAGKSIMFLPVQEEIKLAMKNSVSYLKYSCHCKIMGTKFNMEDTCEIGCSILYGLNDIPNLIINPENPKEKLNLFVELLKSLLGFSSHKFNIILFYMLRELNGLIPRNRGKYYEKQAEKLRQEIITELGNNGVLLYPTFPTSAFNHAELLFKIPGVMYAMIFNILGFPCTHVPMGFDKHGLPVGIQVVAAPNQDKLCIAVAKELERGFGGWTRPSSK